MLCWLAELTEAAVYACPRASPRQPLWRTSPVRPTPAIALIRRQLPAMAPITHFKSG